MVEEIEVVKWDSLTWPTNHPLYQIRLNNEEDLREIAERLQLPYIFRRENELICSDGRILYWYKPS